MLPGVVAWPGLGQLPTEKERMVSQGVQQLPCIFPRALKRSAARTERAQTLSQELVGGGGHYQIPRTSLSARGLKLACAFNLAASCRCGSVKSYLHTPPSHSVKSPPTANRLDRSVQAALDEEIADVHFCRACEPPKGKANAADLAGPPRSESRAQPMQKEGLMDPPTLTWSAGSPSTG